MWGWIGEMVAPAHRSPHETVRQNWQMIRRFLIDKVPEVQQGQIEHNIHTIMKVLLEEEDGLSTSSPLDSTATDCLEYVLSERILETLCVLAVEDRPIGIRRVVTLAISTLLKGISRPLLPHVSVHKSINQLISSLTTPEDVESFEFWALLGSICRKVSQEPMLVSFLVTDTSEFPLFQGLRRRLKRTKMSEDNSRRGMVQVVGAITFASTLSPPPASSSSSATPSPSHDTRLTRTITSSGFGNDVAEGLACDFKDLLSHATSMLGSAEKREVESVQSLPEYELFFNRFRFLVALASVSCLPILQNSLHELSHTFLNSVFISSLLSPSPIPVHVATVALRDMIRELQVVENGSPEDEKFRIRHLSDTLLALLLGGSPYLVNGLEMPSHLPVQQLLMKTLLQRIEDGSSSLSTCTLKLWLSLMLLHNRHVFYVLIWEPLSTSETVTKLCTHFGNNQISGYQEATSELIKMHRFLNSICSREGDEAIDEVSAFDDYLEDSLSLLSEVAVTYSWEKEEEGKLQNNEKKEKEKEEGEGEEEICVFLERIFAKLEGLLGLELEEALMLTSIVSILAHVPIMRLHWLLLQPPSTMASPLSLIDILWKIIQEVKKRSEGIPDFPGAIEAARVEMDGDLDSSSAPEWVKVVVVLKEFLLELAACVQAKQTLVPNV